MASVPLRNVLLHRVSGTLRQIRLPDTKNGRIGLVINTGDDVALSINGGRETLIDPGGIALLSRTKGTSVTGGGQTNSCFVIDLSEAELLRAAPAAQALIGAAIDQSSEAVSLVKGYVKLLAEGDGFSDPRIAMHAGQALFDIIALAMGAAKEAAEIARQRGMKAVRLETVLQSIAEGYLNPAFSVILVARKLRMSERYVQDLLHGTGSGFSERVLELRLQHAAGLLARMDISGRKVSDIAFSSGFNDVSYFHRCFRRRFGMTPAGARQM